MATYRGDQNKQVYETIPFAPVESGVVRGKVVFMLETLNLAEVGAKLTDGDFIKIGSKLPKGARVLSLEAVLPVDALGVLDVGWEANGAIAADTNGFIDGAANTSVISLVPCAASAKYTQFTAETQLVAEVETTFDGQIGEVKFGIYYILD